MLVKVLDGARRHPALDHPIRFLPNDWGSPSARRAVTAHGLAVWKFFSITQSQDPDMPERAIRAAELCRVLMRAKAPLFSAAPGTGLEDDSGFGLQLFVQQEWPPGVRGLVEGLFHEYAAAGYFDFEAYVQPEVSGVIGGLLPLDAAIRLGNAHAAAAAVRAGCRTDNVATDAMGRSMDLVAYILKSANQFQAETAASVAAALMDKAVGSRCSEVVPAQQAPTRRRRATV
jgi:hypothetical protein